MSLAQFSIRPIRLEDAAMFRELRLDAFRRHPDIFYGADYAKSAAQPLAYWEAQVRSGAGGPTGIIFVAEASGAAEAERSLAGVLALEREESPQFRHNGSIWHIYIRPEWRGVRLADALINTCIGWARGAGIRTLRLSVNADNGAAIRCYVRCGFAVYGVEQERGYRDGAYVDELLMARKIV